MPDQPQGTGGQNIARLLNALPEHLRDAARALVDEHGQRVASNPGELQELSGELINMLLQLMQALAPQSQQDSQQDAGGEQGGGGGGATAGGGMSSGSPSGKAGGGSSASGSPQDGRNAGGEPSSAPDGATEGEQQDRAEGGEEAQADSMPEGQSDDPRQGLSELLQKLIGNQDGADSSSPQGVQPQGEGESPADASDGAMAGEDGDSETQGDESLAEAVEVPPDEGSDAQSESEGGDGEGAGRSEGDPNAPAEPQAIQLTPEEEEQLAARQDLEAFLQVLEKVIKGRSKRPGTGQSRWTAWQPGDVFTEPDEILRYREDDAYSVPPEMRRAIHRRDKKLHLVVVAIDSSGSVNDKLFALLHTGMSTVADMLVEQEDVHLGVCQFSGGARWTLPPTGDLEEIQWFSQQPAERLFHGGTTVSEVFAILGSEIAEYRSVDVVALTDGWVEPGKKLAEKVDFYSSALGCEIKCHGVIFRGRGTTKEFEAAKDLNPVSIRVWYVGKRPPQSDPAAQAARQKEALESISPEQRDKLRQLRDKKKKEDTHG